MPIYEYKCEKCLHSCEIIIHSPTLSGTPSWKRCEKCKAKMKRIPTAHAKTAGKWLV